MASNFIPSFHLVPSSQKLNPKWCKMAMDYYWNNTNIKSLLWDKNIDQIEQFATGAIKMRPFTAMYKSIKKKMLAKENNRFLQNEPDLDNIAFQPFPLIQPKLNSAISLTQKIPVEISCVANDALAMKKRKEDINFLKEKPKYEQQLKEIAEEMDIEFDLGTTEHSSTKFSSNPLGMNLNNPEEEKMFMDLMYALQVETAMEEVLQQFYDFKNVKQIRLLETKDQYKYAVSCNRGFISSMTGLPDAEYVYPGDVYVGESRLPDYADRDERFWEHRMSINDAFNMFSDEITSKEMLETIINGKDLGDGGGYCVCNNVNTIDTKNFNTAKINMVYCEIRSVDWVGIHKNPKSKLGAMTFTDDEKLATEKIWGQNTYSFWWLKNTKYFFKIEVLPYAHRTKGLESYQNHSISINRSNDKSSVELSIGENIKAQIADIKMAFAVIMAKADGVYIDIRGLRNAAAGLTDEANKYTTYDLLVAAIEKNTFIADTTGFEGKNDGQFKPVIPIEGGIKNVLAYLQVIQSCNQNINQFIGTNDSLTGMSANPDALIGVEKQRINASINALHYVTDAIEMQMQKLLNVWGNSVQYSIKAGGKPKAAMVNYIGSDDVDLIAGLNETPLHNLTLKISLTQREVERQKYEQQLNYLKSKDIITSTEEFLLSSISNPKKRFAQLAVIENKYKKEQEKIRQQQYEQAMALRKEANDGLVAATNAATDGKIKLVYATADAQSKILQLQDALGLNKSKIDFLGKKYLQQDRAQSQLDKAIKTAEAKVTAKNQEPLALV